MTLDGAVPVLLVICLVVDAEAGVVCSCLEAFCMPVTCRRRTCPLGHGVGCALRCCARIADEVLPST